MKITNITSRLTVKNAKKFFDSEQGIYIALLGLIVFLSHSYFLALNLLREGEGFFFSLVQAMFFALVTSLVIRQSNSSHQKVIFSATEAVIVSTYYARSVAGDWFAMFLALLFGAFTAYAVYTLSTLGKDDIKAAITNLFCPECGKKLPGIGRKGRQFCSKKCSASHRTRNQP